jgi:hypothetical protein
MSVLEGLTSWWQLDSTSCTPVDDELRVWQVKTSNGMRLLDLDDTTAVPWSWVLCDALEHACWISGVQLHLELPPAGREGDPSDVLVRMTRGSLETRASHGMTSLALLKAWVAFLTRRVALSAERLEVSRDEDGDVIRVDHG